MSYMIACCSVGQSFQMRSAKIYYVLKQLGMALPLAGWVNMEVSLKFSDLCSLKTKWK